jgi:hypothetical protein
MSTAWRKVHTGHNIFHFLHGFSQLGLEQTLEVPVMVAVWHAPTFGIILILSFIENSFHFALLIFHAKKGLP